MLFFFFVLDSTVIHHPNMVSLSAFVDQQDPQKPDWPISNLITSDISNVKTLISEDISGGLLVATRVSQMFPGFGG